MSTVRDPLAPVAARVPPLASGDRLSRNEFERRYEAMPDLKKAELVEGVVYVASATRIEEHGSPHGDLMAWLGLYRSRTPGVDLADNCTVRLDPHNELQPDALLRVAPHLGGQSTTDRSGYVSGPPELVAEVAASSASYDLHDKLEAYRRNGVREYLVWRVLDGALDWLRLEGDRYVVQSPGPDGLVPSVTFPGLWLDGAALLRRDLATVVAGLERGLASPEHATFVQRLTSGA